MRLKNKLIKEKKAFNRRVHYFKTAGSLLSWYVISTDDNMAKAVENLQATDTRHSDFCHVCNDGSCNYDWLNL